MTRNIKLNVLIKWKELFRTYFLVISVFMVFLILSDNIVGFRESLRLNTNTFPITAGSSLLIHSDWNHFYNNLFLIILLAPIMVILVGTRKSIFLLFAIGYAGHIAGLLMTTIINFFISLIYPLILYNLGYDPFNGDIFVTLRGAGISGGISGWIGIIVYQWIRFLRKQDSYDNEEVYYFYWIVLLASILVLSITDIFNFLGYYSPFLFMMIPGDFFFQFPINRGTPFLTHLICIILGLIINIKSIKLKLMTWTIKISEYIKLVFEE
ncbi:MAG: hypothetical protein ACFFAU_19685 [Candidatus Hodarchaeota archaeon]